MEPNYISLSRNRQDRAHSIIRNLQLTERWQAAGADIHIVGSLRTGLLMNHLDMDFHIYSPQPSPETDFALMAGIATCPGIRSIQYVNLLDTSEACLEWHVLYEDTERDTWQIDMIHIRRGSIYDGHFEKVADRITEILSPEERRTILKLKYQTPDSMKIGGIEYCRAVIDGHVRTFEQLLRYIETRPAEGIIDWMP